MTQATSSDLEIDSALRGETRDLAASKLVVISAQLSERLTRQLPKTHSFGPTAKSASGASTLLPSRSKLTSLIEWEKFKPSPSLVSGFTFLELSIRPTSELVRFQLPNFEIVSSGGKDRPFSDPKSLTGQSRKLFKNLRAESSNKRSF